MIKKLLQKINECIQWTKKHFVEFLKLLWKQHKFMFFSLVISVCLCFLQFIIIITDTKIALTEKYIAFIFVIPFIILVLITFFATKTFIKFPKLTKIFTFFFNSFIILYIQLLWGGYFLFFIELASIGKIYDNPLEYEKALHSIDHVERIAHFPFQIPQEAKNVELNKETNAWFGSEAIILKFNINKEYIENELSKIKYIHVETPGNYNHIFNDAMLTNNGRIKVSNYTFYVINDKENENNPEYNFPYHYGIGVNKEKNSIIYYYVNPD